MSIADLKTEYRATKEIVETMIKNCSQYSDFEFKSIYQNEKMFYCVRKKGSNDIYEPKITKKKIVDGERMVPDKDSTNKDATKTEFLSSLMTVLPLIYRRINWNSGNVLITDDMNDYQITMTKKKGLTW